MIDADFEIDAIGLLCPEPLMIVRNKVRTMQSGESLHITATDPSTARDFANFCRFMGHQLAVNEPHGDVLSYVIRKG